MQGSDDENMPPGSSGRIAKTPKESMTKRTSASTSYSVKVESALSYDQQ